MIQKGSKGLNASMWAPNNPTRYRLSSSSSTASSSFASTQRVPNPTTIRPAVPSSSSNNGNNNNNKTTRPHQELQKFEKIAQRLRWKLFQLSEGFERASSSSSYGEEGGSYRAQAEFMFKLDFYEYYMLLERALVHLMAVFGIVILPGSGGNTMRRNREHAYHQNVLAALDDTANPLHDVLGKGNARESLGRAKELRNRWKYLEDGGKGQQEVPLVEYQLDRMLGAILEGLERAYLVAREKVDGIDGLGSMGEAKGAEERAEVPWDFMVDAMDWEAV